jgi:hypothetical protein
MSPEFIREWVGIVPEAEWSCWRSDRVHYDTLQSGRFLSTFQGNIPLYPEDGGTEIDNNF